MASYTSKLNLKKPEPTDFYNIKDFNDNMEKIDVHKHSTSDITDFPDSNVNTLDAKLLNNMDEFNKYINNVSGSMADKTHYNLLIDVNFQHPVLGGGQYYLEGYKAWSTYEWQTVTSYNMFASHRQFSRSKANGEWKDWADNNGQRYHGRITLTSGTIKDKIIELANNYYGGDIVIAGYAPPDTYLNSTYGLIKWNKSGSTIFHLQFVYDRSPNYIVRSITPSENLDTGWVMIDPRHTPQYNTSNSLFVRKRDVGGAGGFITLEKPTTTLLKDHVYTDVINEMLRIYSTMDGSNYKYATLNFANLAVGENYLATFRGSTTDVTAGVTNIGKSQLFIVYE